LPLVRVVPVTPLESLRAFLETIPREFLVAMADTAEREDRIEILERENERLREHRCRVSVPVVDLLMALRREFDK
jgi:hypothetical protein